MKQLQSRIKETNLSKLEAYALNKSTNSMSASELVGKKMKVLGYVITNNTLTEFDEETGEVKSKKEFECLTLKGEEFNLGTNSPTFIKNFSEILDVLMDEGLNLADVELVISQGQSQRGKFNTIELVL